MRHTKFEEMSPTETRNPNETRDPNDMNNYLQVQWEDLFAEPEGIRSINCVWKSAFQVYRCSVTCCYGFLTIIFAIPIAFCIGLNFACLAFQHIWCLGPALRQWKIGCHVMRRFLDLLLSSTVGPFMETFSLVYSRIHIRHQKLDSSSDKTFEV